MMKMRLEGCTVEKVITNCDIEYEELELDSISDGWDS